MKNSKSFTLLEAMLVCAIIVMLVSLTIPNFTKARTKLRKTLCINNMCLLDDAAELYQCDYTLSRHSLIDPDLLWGEGKHIEKEPLCPEGDTKYPLFYFDLGPVCPHGPTTTDPVGDGTFPEHICPR